ncbi:MAG: MBL fold metallo-hydrolase [Candidatus Lokiarchaeota archaeon]|nr:MBL fold metallo-hydrolase [Candidatus Lokiarchaeota archaeon]MBD3343378.1 MBL fold metallo-hydrolase [Candidatus Lokiarchaeota archaeon]
MKMKITFIGTAGSFISAERTYPSILINDDFLLDCGEGTTQKLIQIEAINEIKTICLTHLHNDHFVGIFSLLWYYWLSERSSTLEVIAPPGTQSTINQILDLINTPMGMRTSFSLNFIELENKKGIQSFQKNYSISAVKTKHTVASFAYRIEKKLKSVCYSSDTAPSKKVINLAKNCDLLIHEATFPNKFRNVAHKYGHSTPFDLAKIALESNSKKVAMVHISTAFQDQINQFKVEAEEVLGKEVFIPDDLTEMVI